jgi:hypothetical protein
LGVQPIECDSEDTGNLDVVNDVTGVDSPYEEYVDEWNEDVPDGGQDGGDDAIDQVYDDAGVHDAMADDAFEVEDAGAVEFEAVFDDSATTTLPPQPKAPRGGTTPTQDGDSRPTRVRKLVSRLIPSFKGKSYGTTMTQIGAQMVGMTKTESIRHMEKELESMGVDDGNETAMGVILTNMSIKQLIAKLGFEPTMKLSKAEMKQIHMRDSFVPKHYRELTRKQKARMVESFIFLKEKKDGMLKARAVQGGNVQHNYITKDEASSPTAYTEAVILTAIIDAKEKRDVATVDLPNAF